MPNLTPGNPSALDPEEVRRARLDDLQQVLNEEIPMCVSMGICVESQSMEPGQGLVVSMPLERNRNHQRTAFAGSLNALCTIAGWGATYLELRAIDAQGVIVIRRSSIKYHRPVDSALIKARCLPLEVDSQTYFQEMLHEKGQAKLDFAVEIAGKNRPAVLFQGSYVVMPPGS